MTSSFFVRQLVLASAILPVIGFLGGGLAAWATGRSLEDSIAISIETGIQNATLGITLAGLISGQTEGGFSTMALPSAVYGITMYLVAIPFVAWFRER